MLTFIGIIKFFQKSFHKQSCKLFDSRGREKVETVKDDDPDYPLWDDSGFPKVKK